MSLQDKPHTHFDITQVENGWLLTAKIITPLAPEDIKAPTTPFEERITYKVDNASYVYASISALVDGLRDHALEAEQARL